MKKKTQDHEKGHSADERDKKVTISTILQLAYQYSCHLIVFRQGTFRLSTNIMREDRPSNAKNRQLREHQHNQHSKSSTIAILRRTTTHGLST